MAEVTQSMLKVANLSHSFYAEAIAATCYLQNLSYTKVFNYSTPHQLWTILHPNLWNLKIFGCYAYSYNHDDKQKKLENKTWKCFFIDYTKQNGVKGHWFYHTIEELHNP